MSGKGCVQKKKTIPARKSVVNGFRGTQYGRGKANGEIAFENNSYSLVLFKLYAFHPLHLDGRDVLGSNATRFQSGFVGEVITNEKLNGGNNEKSGAVIISDFLAAAGNGGLSARF